MIISTGMRTDIPAFYPKWLIKRFEEGYVYVRNPYYPSQVSRYELNTDVVDCIAFCTKNPLPLFPYLDKLNKYKQFWFMTITPYGHDLEPNVLPIEQAIEAFKKLSRRFGVEAVSWRYDPILFGRGFDKQRHVMEFEKMAKALSGYTQSCVISFLEMYKKVERNAPGIHAPSKSDQIDLLTKLGEIAKENGIEIRACMSKIGTDVPNINFSGCQSKEVIERAIKEELDLKPSKNQRSFCACLLGKDIGEYNSCLHLCKYCYANYDEALVRARYAEHDDDSPFLIGNLKDGDKITNAKQVGNRRRTLSLF